MSAEEKEMDVGYLDEVNGQGFENMGTSETAVPRLLIAQSKTIDKCIQASSAKEISRWEIPSAYFWCGRRDLNPYSVNYTPLKRARLPVPPLSHI